MTITILGKRWKFSFGRVPSDSVGICDAPTKPRKEIRISKDIHGLEQLDTIVHELLHAMDWSRDEEYVEQAATDIANALWKIGYRKCE